MLDHGLFSMVCEISRKNQARDDGPFLRSSLGLRYKDHLRRIIADGRPVKVSILRRHLKPAPRQQVRDLIAEKIPQRPGKHEPLLAPVQMPDGKNHLHVVPLLRTMERGYALADAHLTAIGGLLLVA